ncbi:MAG: PIN domain-containing protein [Planctomycetaceae bacterium]|jgi:predicted nucleic acid-binding protein|nr:PIN domain-containing protein [Planctomycetaceae bacterium]
MLRLLLDTNIIIDLSQQRQPFCTEAVALVRQISNGNNYGFVAATTITNMFYILRKFIGRSEALLQIKNLLGSKNIDLLAVDKQTLIDALEYNLTDFEDSVQLSVADFNRIDYIVTRNLRDFRESFVPAISPTEALQKLSQSPPPTLTH